MCRNPEAVFLKTRRNMKINIWIIYISKEKYIAHWFIHWVNINSLIRTGFELFQFVLCWEIYWFNPTKLPIMNLLQIDIKHCYQISWASPVAQWQRIHLPAQETQVESLEEEMATHSSILAGITPWTEEPGELQSMGSRRVRHGWTHMHT